MRPIFTKSIFSCLSYCFLLFVLIAGAATVAAQEAKTPPDTAYAFFPEITHSYTLDGKMYGRSTIFNFVYRALLNKQAPDAIFLTDNFRFFYGSSGKIDRLTESEQNQFREKYPSLYPLRLPDTENGIPNFFAISKWTQPIQVSFAISKDGTDPLMETKTIRRKQLESFLPPLLPHIIKTAATINDTIGTIREAPAINVNPNNFYYEDVDGYGNLHIVFFHDRKAFDKDQYLKRLERQEHIYSGSHKEPQKSAFILDIDRHLNYPIAFTPQSQKQVEGQFYTNAKNEIQFSVCYIPIFVHDAFIKSLIDECLLRSMGIPGSIQDFIRDADPPAPMLSYWNDQEKWNYRRQHKSENGQLPVTGITPLDLLLLKILYNPDISAGMDMKDIHRLFTAKQPPVLPEKDTKATP